MKSYFELSTFFPHLFIPSNEYCIWQFAWGSFKCTRRILVWKMTAVAKQPQEENCTIGKYVLRENIIYLFIYQTTYSGAQNILTNPTTSQCSCILFSCRSSSEMLTAIWITVRWYLLLHFHFCLTETIPILIYHLWTARIKLHRWLSGIPFAQFLFVKSCLISVPDFLVLSKVQILKNYVINRSVF